MHLVFYEQKSGAEGVKVNPSVHFDTWRFDTWQNDSTLGFIPQILIRLQKPDFDHHKADNASFTMVTILFL